MQKSAVVEWFYWANVSFDVLWNVVIVQSPLLSINKRLRVIVTGSWHGQKRSATNQRRNAR